MNRALFLITAAIALLLGACEKSKIESSADTKTEYRTDFTPEEFGIGRPHTKNSECNERIDNLLEQIRACYNDGSGTDCAALQHANSDKIGKLKNTEHCRR